MSLSNKDFSSEYRRVMAECEKLRKEIRRSVLELRKFNLGAKEFNRNAAASLKDNPKETSEQGETIPPGNDY